MKNLSRLGSHFLLCLVLAFLFIPLYVALIAASHDAGALLQSHIPYLPGHALWHNMHQILMESSTALGGEPLSHLLWNSFCMAGIIAFGKIVLALLSAFALVYCRLPFKNAFFTLIFLSMMLPIEVRIIPTFQVVSHFGWGGDFLGLTLPLMASATATFLFRQFFKTIPTELVDAAILDGATPWRFFWDILIPLAKIPMSALFIILFVYGWNQYIWPLVITNDPHKATVVMGISYLAGIADSEPQWHIIMCVALLALIPPCIMVLLAGRLLDKGVLHS